MMKCSIPECNGTVKDKRGKYCSRSCAAKVNNVLSPKRSKSATRKCTRCPNRIPRSRAVCDECRIRRTVGQQDEYVAKWLKGEVDGSYRNGQLSKYCRRYLLEQAGYKCTRCGWAEINPKLNRPILSVDHIDGNWRNNSFDNLVVLCYNCHTLTPTFNALNVGNGAGIRGSGNRYMNS